MTTTPSGRTAGSATSRRRPTPTPASTPCNGTGRCAHLRASRPVPLHHRAWYAQIAARLYSSPDESWGSGHQPLPLGSRDFMRLAGNEGPWGGHRHYKARQVLVCYLRDLPVRVFKIADEGEERLGSDERTDTERVAVVGCLNRRKPRICFEQFVDQILECAGRINGCYPLSKPLTHV